MGQTLVDLYCASFRYVPKQIVLDVDDTSDAVHGGQQLRLFNAHYDEYGSQPIVVFDGDGRIVTVFLCPAKRPKGTEIRDFLYCLLRAIRANWPTTKIPIRANSLDFIFGTAPTSALRRHVLTLEASTAARYEAGTKTGAKTGKLRCFKEFLDGAASWSRVERIIARVEVADQGADTRFIITNRENGRAKALYEKIDCRRGAAENHIKSWKAHLAADRTSCTKATANQFRLFCTPTPTG